MADRINSAIRYPLFLIGTAAVILLFFLIYVVPQFEPVFKDLGGRLNSGAALIVGASIWLRTNVDLFLGICLSTVLCAWLGLSRREWRVRIVAAFARLPGISGPMSDRRTARIVGTLGLLLENGVALPTALKILRDDREFLKLARPVLSRCRPVSDRQRRPCGAGAATRQCRDLERALSQDRLRAGRSVGTRLPIPCSRGARPLRNRIAGIGWPGGWGWHCGRHQQRRRRCKTLTALRVQIGCGPVSPVGPVCEKIVCAPLRDHVAIRIDPRLRVRGIEGLRVVERIDHAECPVRQYQCTRADSRR